MPELPEVETVRRTLVDLVSGKKISSVIVTWENIIKHPKEVEEFQLLLQGQTIQDIKRRGKFLLFILDEFVLVSHLRMEGKFRVFHSDEEVAPHTHVCFAFTDHTVLRYQDVRKFGTMHLFTKGEELKQPPLVKLGPEPLSDELTPDYLKEKLRKTNRKIKIALLDQEILVGLGNIYVDEVLFKAGIYPEIPASSLTDKEINKLVSCIIETLQEAVDQGGSTIRSYVNSQGKIGTFQETLKVYGRKGLPCVKCGHEIEKIVVGGRGTSYCPICQKKNND
ncbi:DNA-formamidopyrimidine glycosylase [Bacillus sp. RG28]|uniref:Formamidopyrimidine-DNA glycosylase n=1 Tax=Gottfriedia endophytica TaxID=2820819 RepID=A0A940NSE5_9BACI|nr:DNA-formamidopyrimidine glycosylase [Gottfriedia endophytica]MBP0724033.1 DNA-formamidopyrimidine glycosylase [Gottfriedia endophytica]